MSVEYKCYVYYVLRTSGIVKLYYIVHIVYSVQNCAYAISAWIFHIAGRDFMGKALNKKDVQMYYCLPPVYLQLFPLCFMHFFIEKNEWQCPNSANCQCLSSHLCTYCNIVRPNGHPYAPTAGRVFDSPRPCSAPSHSPCVFLTPPRQPMGDQRMIDSRPQRLQLRKWWAARVACEKTKRWSKVIDQNVIVDQIWQILMTFKTKNFFLGGTVLFAADQFPHKMFWVQMCISVCT